MIEETLLTVLQTTGKPVYSLSVPTDGTYPCIVYQRVSTVQYRSHSQNELERPRFQITCWAKKYSDAKTLSESVKTALDLNQVNFDLATKENEFDYKETETGLYSKVLDFFVYN